MTPPEEKIALAAVNYATLLHPERVITGASLRTASLLETSFADLAEAT